MTVQPDSTVHIHPIELNEITGVPVDRELLPVPSDTSGQGSPTRSRRVPRIEVTFDSPVVWEIQSPPVCDFPYLFDGQLVIQEKVPSSIEVFPIAGLYCQSAKDGSQHHTYLFVVCHTCIHYPYSLTWRLTVMALPLYCTI